MAQHSEVNDRSTPSIEKLGGRAISYGDLQKMYWAFLTVWNRHRTMNVFLYK